MVKERVLVFDERFTKKYRKLDKSLQIEGDKKILRLKEKLSGKPLFDVYPNLYELYLRSYRIYYLVEDNQIRIMILAIEHKNNQQKFLNQAKKFIEQLKENS